MFLIALTALNRSFSDYVEIYPRMTWHKYHRLGTIHQYMRHLAETHPDICQVEEIGTSNEGRPILIAKVGRQQSYAKPAVFIEGGEFQNNAFINALTR